MFNLSLVVVVVIAAAAVVVDVAVVIVVDFGFYDTLIISGYLASLSTLSVKSPTNFAQRL